MNNLPLVSVVVPSMNRMQYIRATIDSILEQDYPNVECIVMDGGSKDGTVEILQSYGNRIRWVSEPDGGQCAAIDKGLRLSDGEICTWLNADDVFWTTDTVRRAVDEFARDPADVLYGDCAALDAAGHHIGDSYVIRGWDLKYAVEHADHCIAQPASFIRRSALERVDYLNTSVIFMDRDLWLRIALNGSIKFVPICFAAARVHENHWHTNYKSAAYEWVETSKKVLMDPRLAELVSVNRAKAMGNAYLRAMHYMWIGRRLNEVAMFGLAAALHDPRALPNILATMREFARQDGRHRTATMFEAMAYCLRLGRSVLALGRARRQT